MAEAAQDTAPALEISSSDGLTGWLEETGVSLAFTTGTSGKLIFIGQHDGKLSIFERSFDRATGLYAEDDALIMAGPYQIWRFDNALAPDQNADGYDRLYVPQVAYVTGDVQAYDVAIAGNGEIVFSSALFSCLATVHTEFSFAPVWHPPFISQLAPDERCLLTGFATEKGAPRYVTVAARTDTRHGWRAEAGVSGAVIDAQSGEVVADGLALPVAPRLAGKHLWVAEGGSGYVGTVNLRSGAFEPVAFCPGYQPDRRRGAPARHPAAGGRRPQGRRHPSHHQHRPTVGRGGRAQGSQEAVAGLFRRPLPPATGPGFG